MSGNRRKRSALLVNNKEIDIVLITLFSDKDCIVAEISYRNTKFYGITSYFEITEETEINIRKTEQILNYSKGQGLLIAADSNARSETCYDTITINEGKFWKIFLPILTCTQ
jgi:sialic acid synthase SpsE